MCLSCHDGNYAQGAMMKNKVYETLPPTYGTYNTVPTLLGNDYTGTGNYLNDHPVGLNATMGCGGQYNWDCTISATGQVLMTGAASSQFVVNYGFFVNPGVYNSRPVVMCTTCHNQHSMKCCEGHQRHHARQGLFRPAHGHLRNDVLHSRTLQPRQPPR